ncbi:MAG TPA: flagellar export chaperone FliS [Anaeromyxobacteraceae bacterium]|nr:flagellar export chaperone FliS [Anaeromyxobacteraceae bacterium]
MMNPTRRYAQAQTETASPERLMVLLFEAALRHMRTGAAALEAGRAAEANPVLARAIDIVAELDATFDARHAPQLAAPLGAVYQFVNERLLAANADRDAAAAREAARAFRPVAEAFTEAVRQVQAGRATAR